VNPSGSAYTAVVLAIKADCRKAAELAAVAHLTSERCERSAIVEVWRRRAGNDGRNDMHVGDECRRATKHQVQERVAVVDVGRERSAVAMRAQREDPDYRA
jgi:hypothetical protein